MMLWHPTDSNNNILNNQHIAQMASEAQEIVLPLGYDVSSLVRKIGSGQTGFAYLKADEWRIWVIALSPFLLLGKLVDRLYIHWMKFVEANRLISSPTISVQDVHKAHELLSDFVNSMSEHYGAEALTPNMHMCLHIKESLLDYGPVYAFWCFNFERYSGTFKAYNTNQHDGLELTYTNKFNQDVHTVDYLLRVNDVSAMGSLDRDAQNFIISMVDQQKRTNIPEILTSAFEASQNQYSPSSFLALSHHQNFSIVTGSEPIPPSSFSPIKSLAYLDLMDDIPAYEALHLHYTSAYPHINFHHIRNE